MKQRTLRLLSLGAIFATAGFAASEPLIKVPAPDAPASAPASTAPAQAAGTPTPASDAKQTKFVLVSTIKGAQANREFQANVQLVQAQRQAAVELNAAITKETDAKKKQDLQTQLDALMVKLNENNAAMTKTYGFSLARNYVFEIETANIYLQVTDEEAAKLEQAAKAKK
ncbi:MAG TPA: hypothetical protein VMC06_14535 [Opitutaceae bacterium]|nr:hypothetical protein [Opitutaceae bacterium]